ncbi:MAG: type II and III secretion system protein, partial [Endomicrobia bacterium]|nr:type II and III secretion system protein [Endomicrobiia bacterium]
AREVQSAMAVAPTGVPIESAVFLFGKFTDALAVSGRLAMLITQGKAKVLSNPRVTTMNNKTAVIIAGEKIPYKSAVTHTTTGGGTGVGQTVQETWEYINAGIQLTVTPTVSPDGWVTLNVRPQVDIPQISAPGVPPTVKSRQTEVTVMVKNNEPLIIGGLISDSDIDAIKKIPLLGDLPILGYLFKYKTSTKRRTELIILITPRVIEN